MKEFGPNGVVTGQTDTPAPAIEPVTTPQRPVLAVLLGGPLAVILVSIFGAVWLVANDFLINADPAAASTPAFLIVLGRTFIFCALNSVVFYITVPVTWAVMGLIMLAIGAHKVPYTPKFYRRIGILLTTITIALVTATQFIDKWDQFGGAETVFAILLCAMLVGIPAGVVLMSLVRRILYWKKPTPH